jgi:hypothetical protein
MAESDVVFACHNHRIMVVSRQKMTITDGIIVAAISAFVAIITQVITYYSSRKKNDADADSSIGEGVESLSNATKIMVDKLSERVLLLENEKTEREDFIKVLEKEWQEERAKMGGEIAFLKGEVMKIRQENFELRVERDSGNARVKELEARVVTLEQELAEYKK